uniref:GOLD domain-containing protein n=1 Tax=Branchiostoma floridae TaxID=7739 RepID=C3Y755_BRAFL|eukprot:XP_002607673.1 hypothetical protein BRAFLDRAFT_82884 [Branchiostoma floridae]
MEGPWTAGLVVLTCYVAVSLAGELTFELADNDRQCFYEDVDAGVKCTLEYQVVTGGHYDVDCLISDPNEKVLYKEIKKQYDTYTWTSEKKGVYKFCFSNEFSTFTHKTVYFDFMVGEEPPLIPEMGDHDTALTQVLAGGNYDVDVVVFEEAKPILKRVRSTSGEHKWTSESGTDVVICFLNKFSIVTSKKIWLRFEMEDPRVSPPPPGPPVPWLHEAATFVRGMLPWQQGPSTLKPTTQKNVPFRLSLSLKELPF